MIGFGPLTWLSVNQWEKGRTPPSTSESGILVAGCSHANRGHLLDLTLAISDPMGFVGRNLCASATPINIADKMRKSAFFLKFGPTGRSRNMAYLWAR